MLVLFIIVKPLAAAPGTSNVVSTYLANKINCQLHISFLKSFITKTAFSD